MQSIHAPCCDYADTSPLRMSGVRMRSPSGGFLRPIRQALRARQRRLEQRTRLLNAALGVGPDE